MLIINAPIQKKLIPYNNKVVVISNGGMAEFVRALIEQLGSNQYVGKILTPNGVAFYCMDLKLNIVPKLTIIYKDNDLDDCSLWETALTDETMTHHV